jgi:hypothetical protein
LTASTPFFNSSRRKSTNGPCAKEQLFFLAEQSLLSTNASKSKYNRCVFFKTWTLSLPIP